MHYWYNAFPLVASIRVMTWSVNKVVLCIDNVTGVLTSLLHAPWEHLKFYQKPQLCSYNDKVYTAPPVTAFYKMR